MFSAPGGLVTDLSTKIGKIRLENPTMVASGIMDEDAGSMQRIIDNGAGAIVTKSIGLTPRTGYANPTIVELEHGILNAMGLPNPGVIEFKKELALMQPLKVPIIASIYASSAEEFAELAKSLEPVDVTALELNLSCPHASNVGLETGSDPTMITSIIQSIKAEVGLPVFVKLSPNVTDIQSLAVAAEKAGADAIVAINTVKAMAIDLKTQYPILSNKLGGYSGKAIKPIGIRCIYDIAKVTHIPLIGVGGITSGADALEYIMAGASAVQIGTAVYYRGLDVFNLITEEIKQWMKHQGYSRLSDLIGVGHQ